LIHNSQISRSNLRTFSAWVIPIACYLFLVLFIGPRRGAPWFSDDGLFLRMSLDAANGNGWDQMLPQSPSYLFNAALMKFGVSELLTFRIVNYSLCLLGSFIFFVGLDPNGLRSRLAPIAVAASILVYLNSVECPNSLVLHFFLIGSGCYFLSQNSSKWHKHVLLFFSAMALALSGFMHAAAAIGILIIGAVICFMDPKTRKSLFPYVLAVVLLGLWAWYIYVVELSTLLKVPAAHETSFTELLKRIYLILKFPLIALIYYLVFCLFLRGLGEKKFGVAKYLLILSSIVLAFLSLTNKIFLMDWAAPGLMDMHQIPGAVYYSLFFTIFCAIGVAYQGFPKRSHSLISNVCIFVQDWVKENSYQTQNYKYLIAIAGFLLLPAGLAAGSNTAILVGLVYFSGPVVGLVMMISLAPKKLNWYQLYGFAAAWMTIFLVFTLYYNHPASRPPVIDGEVTLKEAPLNGIRVTRQYHDSLSNLRALYAENNCKDKLLIALDNVPTMYYIFGHSAPNNIGVVRPFYYFPESQILDLLKANNHWCVIDVTSSETQDGINRSRFDNRQSIRDFIKNKSTNSLAIESPGEALMNALIFYSR